MLKYEKASLLESPALTRFEWIEQKELSKIEEQEKILAPLGLR